MKFAVGDRVGCFGKYDDAWQDLVITSFYPHTGNIQCRRVSDKLLGAFSPHELTPIYEKDIYEPEDWS